MSFWEKNWVPISFKAKWLAPSSDCWSLVWVPGSWRFCGSLCLPIWGTPVSVTILCGWLLQDGAETWKVHLLVRKLAMEEGGLSLQGLCGAFRWTVLFHAELSSPGAMTLWQEYQAESRSAKRTGRGREVGATMRTSDWQKPCQSCCSASFWILQSDLIKRTRARPCRENLSL